MRRTMLVALAAGLLALAGCGGDDDGNGEAGGNGDDNSIQVELSPQGDFDQNGTATLTELSDGRTQVVVELFDGPDEVQPVHIHDGSCDDLGDVAFGLNNLEDGRSQTQLDVPLGELEAGDYAINAHESEEMIANYTACGELGDG